MAAASMVTVVLQRGGEGFRGFPPLDDDDFEPQPPSTIVRVFRKHVQPILDTKSAWAGDMLWSVVPPGGGDPVPIVNWEAPLSDHVPPSKNTVTFILEPPRISTSAAVGAGTPSAASFAKAESDCKFTALILHL
jgi:hypothetical protein